MSTSPCETVALPTWVVHCDGSALPNPVVIDSWPAVGIVLHLPGRDLKVLRSGTTARERLPLRTFEYTWARGGRWALAVLPPERLPATATEADAQEAAVGFERAAPPAQAALAYRTLLQRWPGNLLAGIGLGNSLNLAGDAAGAQAAFQAVAERHDSAVAWINLARLRLDAEAAEPAWRQAAQQTLAATDAPR